ncbi:hypothetical protein [Methanopyrus kandleri]|uniref:Uncharacterized membrane protein n=2 Tax=Methanopyrus kandleri TaxID=2320 RepID=Q8TWH5_METKA|nr:hypothetical protein [Methanopyrus kandleri]AAM02272.1 Uncharacterized membrane protein [Methanopyrus kandleri AV19]HII69691.1 hypothetical protein [Methanopyrus kandleri]
MQMLAERVLKWGPILVPALALIGLPGLRVILRSRVASEGEARAVVRRAGLYLGLASPCAGVAAAYTLSVGSVLLGRPELAAWTGPALILTPPVTLLLSYVPGRSESMAKAMLVSSLTTSVPTTTAVWYALSYL